MKGRPWEAVAELVRARVGVAVRACFSFALFALALRARYLPTTRLSSWRASVPTRNVGVAEVLFQRAPGLVRKAFTRPRVDPLPRPLGRPASPALGLRA